MATTQRFRPWRSLVILAVIMLGLAVWAFWPGQTHVPRLGLDLQGGTQVILVPQTTDTSKQLTQDQLDQSVEIIRQRVNGFGVAEADVAVQGSGENAAIVVSVPGVNQQDIAEQLKQTALLDFRPVSAVTNPEPIDLSQSQQPTQGKKQKQKQDQATAGQGSGQAVVGAEPSPSASPSPAADEPQPPIEGDSAQALESAIIGLDCTSQAARQGGKPDNPEKWIVTCDRDGTAKYLLEPAFIKGTEITNASAELDQQGGGWVVALEFNGEGTDKLAEASNRLVKLESPKNQFAIVLDGLVVSAPYFQEPINDGRAQISGTFTADEAKNLAQVLKFGALPLTLDIASVETVSPTLGSDQLVAGLIAGALGLFLVGVYLIAYYRLLGLVAATSLVVAAAITYMVFVILGRQLGLALTLAGVAGAIVAIGITADSFVVYFERIRDEVRDGRSLRAACDAGWTRARNTILAADFVSILAAVILYFLSVGNVRGFAFVLGLTTVIDVMVAFLFTHPVVSILGRTDWFAAGHPWSGVDPRRLGVKSIPGAPAGKTAAIPAGSEA